MKNALLLIALLAVHTCLAQQTQISFYASSGLFSFTGSSTSATSHVNMSDNDSGYTNNPYGSRSGFSYGLGVQLQRISPRGFICGVQTGFESLASRVEIDHAFADGIWSVRSGKTILRTNFINVFPSVGHRFKVVNQVHSDLIVGMDLGIGLSSTERYQFTTTQGEAYSGSRPRNTPGLDLRPRIEIVNYYKRFGLAIGYSRGLTNYMKGWTVAPEANAQCVRFGIHYRLN